MGDINHISSLARVKPGRPQYNRTVKYQKEACPYPYHKSTHPHS